MEFLKNSEETLQYLITNALPEYGYLSTLFVQDAPAQHDDYCEFGEVFNGAVEAPYCTPCAKGVPIYQEVAKLSRFKIPYVRLEDVVTTCSVLEPYMVVGGKILRQSFSAKNDLEKLNLAVIARVNAHKYAINMLKERQAFNFFAYGTGDYRGAHTNGQILDFGRSPVLKNVVLDSANKWDYQNGTILNSLTGADELLSDFGFNLKHIVANPRTMRVALSHPQILEMAKSCCATDAKDDIKTLRNPFFFGAKNKMIGDFVFHSYAPKTRKLDLSGSSPEYINYSNFIPDGMAIFIGEDEQQDISARMFHGKIKSLDAIRNGETYQKIHTKVWQEKDNETVITQSAPMVAGSGNCAFMTRVLL
jgi:thiol-disulfide isomerase/thioredoxin